MASGGLGREAARDPSIHLGVQQYHAWMPLEQQPTRSVQKYPGSRKVNLMFMCSKVMLKNNTFEQTSLPQRG